MQCPVCEHNESKKIEEYSDEHDASRVWKCGYCKTTWVEHGKPIVKVIEIKWDGEACDVDYGPDAWEIEQELEAQKAELELIREAQKRTIPLWQ